MPTPPTPSVTNTFTNGTVGDGPNVSTNFSDLVTILTAGTYDLTVGGMNATGSVTLGNAGSDTITWNGLGFSVMLNNGATDSGAVYFDNGTTAFLKGNAAGTTLSTGGFTDFDHASIKMAAYLRSRFDPPPVIPSYGTTVAIVSYDTVTFDSHSGFSTSTSQFTAPSAGLYYVSAGLLYVSAHYSINDSVTLDVYVNASAYARLMQFTSHKAATFSVYVRGATVVSATAGQTIDIRTSNARGDTNVDYGTSAFGNTQPLANYFKVIKFCQ